MNTSDLTKKTNAIDALLPQTQCEECGFKGCRPYATAMAKGEANINLCPPGGSQTLQALGALLQIDPTPYETEAREKFRAPSVAKIDEAACIGCVKCIKACPVDAIIGAPKLMHTVLLDLCTGCGLCVAPCPVDCISMQPIAEPDESQQAQKSAQWRTAHEKHLARLASAEQLESDTFQHNVNAADAKKAAIAAAITRAKNKL
jgi:electron transport complex protein RnfB